MLRINNFIWKIKFQNLGFEEVPFPADLENDDVYCLEEMIELKRTLNFDYDDRVTAKDRNNLFLLEI